MTASPFRVAPLLASLAASLLALLVGCSDDGSAAGGHDADFVDPVDAGPPDALRPDSDVLPVVMIETGGHEIPEGEKIDATMRVIEDHDGTLVGLADRPTTFEGRIGIEVRGNTSLMFPKHSYGLETRTVTGADLDVPLLGMPAESDWVLYAPYTDKTYMRDRFAYDLGAALGRYQPRTRYVEVFVDQAYVGVYLAIEKIKRGPMRVDIPKVAASASVGDITGGYIFKREGSGDGTGWDSAHGTPWEYHYPKLADVTPEQAGYLRQHIDAFENLMLGPNLGASYTSWIDQPSFVDFVLITELSRNVDGYRKSAYMYKKADADGGLIYMGPLWDFNIAFGNADYCEGAETRGFQYTRDACEDVHEISPWWPRLVEEPAFANALRCRWNALRQDVFSNDALVARLDRYRKILTVAEVRDHATWPIIGEYVWPNAFVGASWDEEVDHLRDWVLERAAWLDEHLPGECQ